MRVGQINGHRGFRISMTSTVRDAARRMLDEDAAALLVTEDGPPRGRIVGIVTERDIATTAAMRSTPFDDLLVADIMQTNVVSIDAGAPIRDALQLMSSHDVRRLAVIDAGGEAAGILFFADVLEAFVQEWAVLSTLLHPPRPADEPVDSAGSPPKAA